MAWWALAYKKGKLCGILGHFCKVTDIFGTFHKQHSDLQTLSNLKNAKKWAVCGQTAPDRRGCLAKCAKNMRGHLPGVVNTGAEAAGVNMRCRHAAGLAPRPFWDPRIYGRLEETRDRLAAQGRPARRV